MGKLNFWQLIRDHFLSKLLAGALVIVPLYATFECLFLMIKLLDRIFSPFELAWFKVSIPGLGVMMTFLLLYTTGWILAGRYSKWTLSVLLQVFSKVPLLSSLSEPIYLWMRTVVFERERVINKPVLVQYPMRGAWTVGFILSRINMASDSYFSILIPMLPIPLTGYLVFQTESSICRTSMTYGQAVKMVFSGGILSPKEVF